MATMRLLQQRFDPRGIGLWLIGVLCGVLLMLGLSGLTHRSHAPQPAAPAVSVAAPAVAATTFGPSGRVVGPGEGLHTAAVAAQAVAATGFDASGNVVRPAQGPFLDSQAAPAVAATSSGTSGRAAGPGEGLNNAAGAATGTAPFVMPNIDRWGADTLGNAVMTASAALVPPPVDELRAYRSQRANAVPQATSFDASGRVVGPGEGLRSAGATSNAANDLPRLDETTYYQNQRLSALPALDRARGTDPR
ncbi:MAG TPA: hypothetical protein VMU89_09085 [Thermomicrobiaceae bacterium]|nr:hypothetical protein [Thermomicrobiaceae bacterium]